MSLTTRAQSCFISPPPKPDVPGARALVVPLLDPLWAPARRALSLPLIGCLQPPTRGRSHGFPRPPCLPKSCFSRAPVGVGAGGLFGKPRCALLLGSHKGACNNLACVEAEAGQPWQGVTEETVLSCPCFRSGTQPLLPTLGRQ